MRIEKPLYENADVFGMLLDSINDSQMSDGNILDLAVMFRKLGGEEHFSITIVALGKNEFSETIVINSEAV